jgi:hypothetical protein
LAGPFTDQELDDGVTVVIALHPTLGVVPIAAIPSRLADRLSAGELGSQIEAMTRAIESRQGEDDAPVLFLPGGTQVH